MSNARFETYCKVMLRGRVATEPEMLVTGRSQRAIFVAAIDRPNDKADRLYVVAWGERAEEVNEKVVRGQLVDVVGSARVNEWEHEGRRHIRLEVHADSVKPVYKDVPAAEEGTPAPTPKGSCTTEPAGSAEAAVAARGASDEVRRPAGNVGEDLPW